MEATIDPYKVLEISKNFTLDELKLQYKRIAVRVHPDKGGSEYMFNLVTDCFKKLLREYKLRTSDKQFFELKGGYDSSSKRDTNSSSYTSPHNYSKMPDEIDVSSPGRFNVKKFNALFEQNRLDQPTDAGYSDWCKKEIDTVVPEFKGANKEAFNQHFEKHVRANTSSSKHIMKYTEPEAMWSSKIPCTELGVMDIDDFSGENTTLKKLQFTDLKLAHSTSRIVDPSTVNRKEYKSVDDLKRDRGNVVYEMDDDEKRELMRRMRKEEELEKKRLAHMQHMDALYEKHHQKMSNMLQYAMK